MGCTLVARDKDFDVEAFLARTTLPFDREHFWIRGSRALRTKPTYHQDSGFSEWVSRDKWKNLRAAIAEVLKFLQANKKELAKLKRTKGVENLMLDFGFNSRVGTEKVAVQGEYFPPEFLRLAGELNIGIGLSIYPPFGEKAAKRKNARGVKNILTNKDFKRWLQRQDKPVRKADRSRTAKLA